MTTSEILELAADYIDTYGWHQGGLFGGDPTVDYLKDKQPACLQGALFMESLGSMAAFSEARIAVDAETGGSACWNDTPGRTKEEVTRMLRGLAAKLSDQPTMTLVDRDCGDEDPSWEVREYQPV